MKHGKILKFLLSGSISLMIFLFIIWMSMCVLSFKYQDGILPMKDYYDLPEDTVDVLFLGSSHVGMNVSTARLWDDYGIAAYKCWGSTQPDWNTYYYLVECLEYQTPKVIVFDVHGATFSYDYADYVLQVKNTLGLRMSANKINAILASAPQKDRSTLLLGLPAYHTRYTELTETDFEYFPWDKHDGMDTTSNETMDRVYPITIPADTMTTGVAALGSKEEKYLRMIIELCREKNIPLELVTSPYAISDLEQQRFRKIREIAYEYGVRFTDFNECYEKYGIDPSSDFLDSGHFNKYGVPKYTKAIAQILTSTYKLPDRRKDPDHIWNRTDKEKAVPVYRLQEQFEGDGIQNYVDTGLQLYKNPLDSWTILAQIKDPGAGDGDKVLFSCFNEADENYYGLLTGNTSEGDLNVRYSSYAKTEILDPTQTALLGIVKDGKEMKVYYNGVLVHDITLDSVNEYDGDLLIGCQQAADGSMFRYSKTTVQALEVYDRALGESDITGWTPELPPEAEKSEYITDTTDSLAELANRFEGDGTEKYVNTGLQLYKNPQESWTMFAQIDPAISAGDNVYISCFAEEQEDYRGILVRRPEENSLNIVYGSGRSINVALPQDKVSTLIIQKDRSAYTVYLNGEKVLDQDVSACNAYDGTLLLGCEQDKAGKLFRYSGVTIYNLKVVQGIVSEKDMLAWNPAYAQELPRETGSAVDYTLKKSFAGNGADSFVDTGMKLYDVADKSWTINMLLDRSDDHTGSVISCFAEDTENYRGLLVRQTDAYTFDFTLGQQFMEITVPPERKLGISIVKDNDTYSIYVNGELQNTAESHCASYNGDLYLGCECSSAGEPFRFSKINIRSFTVSGRALSAEEIRKLYD